jgi:hypothetical protein
MQASRRGARASSKTLRSDLHPPMAGPGADPVLYGVAAALASLFPPVAPQGREPHARGVTAELRAARASSDTA